MKATTRPGDKSDRKDRLQVVIAELLSAIISSTTSFAEMYQIVLDKARWLTESQHGFVSSIEKETGAHISNTLTKMRAEGCSVDATLYSLPEGPHKLYYSLWGHSLNAREGFFTNNPSAHQASVGLPHGHVPLKNFLSVPIILGNEILGQIALANSIRDYTEDDLEAIAQLGEVYAVVLHNRQRENELRRSEERFRSMVEMAPFPLLVTEGAAGTILYANPRATELFAVSSETLIGSDIAKYYRNQAQRAALLDEIAKNGRTLDKEVQLYTAHGKTCWVLLSAVKVNWFGREALMTAINDITDRKDMEEALRRLATVDYLTGIWNRRYFMDQGYKEFERFLRYKSPFSVMIFDLDHFKAINDKYGHNMGDRVLEGVARIVATELRVVDVFGRYGGEEFAILLPEIAVREAAEVAERLRQTIEKCQYPLENAKTLTVTASFGISEAAGSDRTFEEILTRADDALYKAKESGRNRLHCR